MLYKDLKKEQIEGCITPNAVIAKANGLFDVVTHQELENYLADTKPKAQPRTFVVEPKVVESKAVEEGNKDGQE